MPSTKFHLLLTQLIAEYDRVALQAPQDSTSAPFEIEGATGGQEPELVHSKDDNGGFAGEATAQKPARQQLLAATRKLVVKLASMALQQALGDLDGLLDIVLQADSSQIMREAEAAPDVSEEKLTVTTKDVPQQVARKGVMKEEPEPEREHVARPAGLKSPAAKQLASPATKQLAKPPKAESRRTDGKAIEPRSRAAEEGAHRGRAPGAVFGSEAPLLVRPPSAARAALAKEATGRTQEEVEREKYYEQIFEGKVVPAPVPGSGRPDETAEATDGIPDEVVRHANSDAFPGDVMVNLPEGGERSVEECIARGVRFCRGVGYTGFRVVQQRGVPRVQFFTSRKPAELEANRRPLSGRTLVVVRRPPRAQSKLTLVPMGHMCATAIFLKRAGWRCQAFPLDWSCATLQVWDHMLSDDFKTLLAERGPNDGLRNHPYNKIQDCCMFLHQKGWANDDVRRRVDRLRAALKEKRAFGVSMYFEGKVNVHATQQEVLSWAKRLAKPERGFEHIVLVWIRGEAAEPSGTWVSSSSSLSLLRYTPKAKMDYKADLSDEDILKLSSLFQAQFPHVFTGFQESGPATSREVDENSEQDVEDGPGEDIDDIWDFGTGRFIDLEPQGEEMRTPDGKQKVTLGLKVKSGVDMRLGKVAELPWSYHDRDFFMVRFNDTNRPCPRPLANFRTSTGLPLVVDRRVQTVSGVCQDCKLKKSALLSTAAAAGNARYCISCWCKEWKRWD